MAYERLIKIKKNNDLNDIYYFYITLYSLEIKENQEMKLYFTVNLHEFYLGIIF